MCVITWQKYKEYLFVYSFLTLGNIWSRGMTKIRSITKLYKTLLFKKKFIITYEYSKRFVRPVGCTSVYTVQPVVQRVVQCTRTLTANVKRWFSSCGEAEWRNDGGGGGSRFCQLPRCYDASKRRRRQWQEVNTNNTIRQTLQGGWADLGRAIRLPAHTTPQLQPPKARRLSPTNEISIAAACWRLARVTSTPSSLLTATPVIIGELYTRQSRDLNAAHCMTRSTHISNVPSSHQIRFCFSCFYFILFFWPSVDIFPREFKNWDTQNWVQIYQSVQSGVGKLSCNKTALKRFTSTETLWNRKP